MNDLERETLRMMAEESGADPKEFESIIDERLNFRENKKLVRDWLKGEGKDLDAKTEMVAEKELDEKMARKYEKEAREADEAKYAVVVQRKAAILDSVKSRGPDLMTEIEAYNPHCRNITYSTIFAFMNAKLGNQKTHVINKGKQGIGKSRGTSELAKLLDMHDAVILSGYMTPKTLFETIKRHRSATIILDESEMIMNDPQALFILRSALYGGNVAWLTTKGDPSDSFKFGGTIIANMNHFGVAEAESAPLFDRTLFNQNNLDSRQVLEKMKTTKTYQMHTELWNLIKDRIVLLRKEGLEELTEEEEKQVMDYVESLVLTCSVYNKSLSTRAISRARLVTKCVKNLFCGLNDELWALAKDLIKPYVIHDDADDIVVKLLRQNPTLTRKELTELLAEHTSRSERQAYRLVKAAIERGAIKAVNRHQVALP